MASSIGFRTISFLPSCYSSYGALDSYPGGALTHCSCQPSLDAHFPFLIRPELPRTLFLELERLNSGIATDSFRMATLRSRIQTTTASRDGSLLQQSRYILAAYSMRIMKAHFAILALAQSPSGGRRRTGRSISPSATTICPLFGSSSSTGVLMPVTDEVIHRSCMPPRWEASRV